MVDVYATTWGDDGEDPDTSKLLKFTDSYLTTNPTNIPNAELATTTTLLKKAPGEYAV